MVSINSIPSIPVCKYPRERIKTGIRKNRCIYENNQLKKIIYPVELLFTNIDDSDAIEHYIIELKNMWPNWYNIQVELINNRKID
jgi:hypothetical protein